MATKKQSPAVLRHFATDRNLRIQEETLERFLAPRLDMTRWTLDNIHWREGDAVLDIGAGRGSHYDRLLQKWPGLRYYGLDNSPQMLQTHPGDPQRLSRADAMRLPYADNSFDVVMANHLLYHMPDVTACLGEIKRVMKPDGRLLAATESLHTLPELQVLLRRAIVLLSRSNANADAPGAPVDAFALENGARILSKHFYAVVRYDLPAALHFDNIEPALEYVDSMRELRQGGLPGDVLWDDMMLIMRQQMMQLRKQLGKLTLSVVSGALVATDSGGFIADFARRGG